MITDLMIDIETLGTSPGAAILSIGAVPFNLVTGEVSGNHFYERVNLKSCLAAGLGIDADTLVWWLDQSQEARDQAFGDMIISKPIYRVFNELTEFILRYNSLENINVWGNSNRFDLGILDAGYRAVGKSYPWSFRNERDVRTLVHFAPHIKEEMEFEGTEHHPIHDCHHQIKYCVEIAKTLYKQ